MENSFSDRLYILDGGMGTMLQKAGAGAGENTARFAVTHPEILKDIHRQYVEAGSDIILAATFGVSRFCKGSHKKSTRCSCCGQRRGG